MRYLDQVAAALGHLHSHHRPAIVHGDVKPANVIIAREGDRAVLVDFGTSAREGTAQDGWRSSGFSAPEQSFGEPLFPAADVYSLAATAYHLLTGGHVGDGKDPVFRGLDDAAARNVREALGRAMSFVPEQRPATASDLVSRLRQAVEMNVPTGTVTLCLVRLGSSAVGARADLVDALETIGGRRVPVERADDEVLFGFVRSTDGLASADAVERVMREHGGEWRVALHAGDIGGWHGGTVRQIVEELRAMLAVAPPTRVVCSPAVRLLLGSASGRSFDPHVRHGFLVGRHGRPSSTTESALEAGGAWVAATRRTQLFGHDAELVTARAALDAAIREGRPPVLTVLGDSGFGKSRFLAELAHTYEVEGAVVLVGKCAEVAGAYEPFLTALGEAAFPFTSAQIDQEQEGWIDRRRFFSQVSDLFRQHQSRTMVLVLDDLQWIDASSAALLDHVLGRLRPGLIVIGAYRTSSPLPAELEAVRSRHDIALVRLGELSVDAVSALAESLGLVPAVDTVEVHQRTGGHPFFVLEVLHDLQHRRDRSATRIPDGVRAWVRSRVEALGAVVEERLSMAAVVGREFDVVTLARLRGESPLALATVLEPAVMGGLLESPEDEPGMMRFAHAIVQATLAESVSASRRALLHAGVGEILADEVDGRPELVDAALHHLLAAGRLGDPMGAAAMAVRAADVQIERLAFEEAARVVRRALDNLRHARLGSERDRVAGQLHSRLGRALLLASQPEAAREALTEAAELAMRVGDGQTLARTALAAALQRRHGVDNPELLDLVRRAFELCPADLAELRALLVIRLARLYRRRFRIWSG